MATYVVSAGEVSTGTVLGNDDTEIISSGGVAIGTVVSNGGQLDALPGGITSGTILQGTADNQGFEFIYSSGGSVGLAVSTVISSGGELVVEGITSGTIILSGGFEFGDGGVTYGTVVSNGGDESLEFGDTAIGAIISSGGIQADYFGIASGTIISAGGNQGIKSGSAIGTIIESGGYQVVSVGGMASGTVVHAGGMETLYTGGAISDTALEAGGSIDLAFLANTGDGSAVLDAATDVLTVTEGSHSYALSLAGDYTGEFFYLSPGSTDPTVGSTAPGTLITVETAPCYCRGTLILTDQGEVAVEDLRIGDSLVTLSGAVRPIRWIGWRSYSGRFVNPSVLPVQFLPGSLADGVPKRDLLVSPQHAMFLGDALVPAIALVNGVSIAQVQSIEQVEYFHLELEVHDVILAEGTPSETFVDDGSRTMFHNAMEYAAIYPDAAPQPARYCAPRLEEGPALEALRQRLAARYTMPATEPGPLVGYVDQVSLGQVVGWAQDAAGPVLLQIIDNGVVLGQVEANAYRPDLVRAGVGDGWHGFEFVILGGLSPLERHVIEVWRVSDGAALQRSPWILGVDQRRVA